MPHSPEAQQNSPEKKLLHHIRDLAQNEVIHTDEFQSLRARIYKESDDPSYATAEAFRQTAASIASNEESELSEADRSLLKVTGQLGVYAQAQAEVTRIYEDADEHLSNHEYKTARHLKDTYLIPFNHDLKAFINDRPNDNISEVTSALAGAHALIFSRHTPIQSSELIYADQPRPVDVAKNIEDVLNGLRHEVAAEAMLIAAGVEYKDEVTVKEDASGNDMFVKIDGNWEGIDIKASRMKVLREREKRPLSRAVWTGLEWSDFTGQKGTGHGTLATPYAITEKKSAQFVASIEEMVRHRKQQRAALSRKSGRHTLSRV